jgi:dienelactone hydrolase
MFQQRPIGDLSVDLGRILDLYRQMKGLLLLLLLLIFTSSLWADEPASLPASTPWDLAGLKAAPNFAWEDTSGKVSSLTYEGLSYKGKPTRVFAYYAHPKNFGVEGDVFPAMVLVHGGGGAAFEKWARLWAQRGYVAIAMDLAGKGADRKSLQDGGPDQGHEQKFATIDEPNENQWSYHAVANVILAHSLIRPFDEVDVDRVGITGISWGGYLTCMVAGLDDRFSFAMPVYGCGFLQDNSCWKPSDFARMNDVQRKKWHLLWDPSMYLASARMPVFFVNGSNDFAYPLDSHAKTCDLVRTEKNYSIQLAMAHGHIFDFPEFFLAADQFLTGGVRLPVISKPLIEEDRVVASVSAVTPLAGARLHFTTGPHAENQARTWTTQELVIDGDRLTGARPPDAATAWYVDVRDERKALISSEVIIK